MQTCTNHANCLNGALRDAEVICHRQDARLTPIRKQVLELVWQSHKPVKAYDVLAQLQQGMPSAKPPTVYRALDFLLEHHLIHKLQRLNAYIGCQHRESDDGECYFLICTRCRVTQEMQHPSIHRHLNDTIRQHHFLPQQVTVEVEGICSACLCA